MIQAYSNLGLINIPRTNLDVLLSLRLPQFLAQRPSSVSRRINQRNVVSNVKRPSNTNLKSFIFTVLSITLSFMQLSNANGFCFVLKDMSLHLDTFNFRTFSAYHWITVFKTILKLKQSVKFPNIASNRRKKRS